VRVTWTEEALVDQPGVTLWIASLDVPVRDERVHLGSIRAVEGAFLPPHRATFYEIVDQRLGELRLGDSLREEIGHLKLKRATSRLENPMSLKATKRDLARVETVLREKARQGQ